MGRDHLQRARRLLESVRGGLDLEARRQEEGFQRLRALFYREYWSDAARATGAEIEDFGHGFLRIRRDGQSTFVRGYEVQLDDHLTLKLAGNKPLTHRLLMEYGYPTPRFLEFRLAEIAEAERFLNRLPGAAVVKPASGTGGGNGVTTRIDTAATLRRAAHRAASYHPKLLVEEQVTGDSFRLLYLNGRFIDAVRRDPPRVAGDGIHSVSALVREETRRRLSSETISALSPLTLDMESRAALREQGLTGNSIPAKGVAVIVKAVVNQNAARENHSVRDEIHPSIVQMGREVVTRFGIELGGLDLLTPDIGVPLAECGGVINEVNTTPGLHHHVLMAEENKRQPIAEMILEYIFGRAQERQVVNLAAEQVAPS